MRVEVSGQEVLSSQALGQSPARSQFAQCQSRLKVKDVLDEGIQLRFKIVLLVDSCRKLRVLVRTAFWSLCGKLENLDQPKALGSRIDIWRWQWQSVKFRVD